MNYELFMAEAIAEARRGGEEGEVPVGAVAVLDDAMIARDHDRTTLQRDPTAHAVLLTLQGTARKLESRRLSEVTIFTTHEPCAMCVGALLECEVDGLVYAMPDARSGAVGSVDRGRLSVVAGIMQREAAELRVAAVGARRS
jgi:tRNA(adenine34) deaminase